MIKYLGSKRRLVPVLGDLITASGASTALDLFTGTTRVAQEFRRRGVPTTAVDTARYSHVLAQCYIAHDPQEVDLREAARVLASLNGLSGIPGYVTETFCVESRFFQPFNGERIDAIRDEIERTYAGSPLEPILLTSLLLASDRVDSTTGLQMAYIKQWSKRSEKPLDLRLPDIPPGPVGAAHLGDATELARQLGPFDLAYLDPPYNQHRYYTNYHVWETIVAWDRPNHYGIACKRVDCRDDATKSVFNMKKKMPIALGQVIADVQAEVVVVSYNNESWITLDELRDMCSPRGHVEVLAFELPRYIGAQIGIHNPAGDRVGEVSHTSNLEYIAIAGPRDRVTAMAAPFAQQVTSR